MTYRTFKGQPQYWQTKISKTIESNLIEFINWGFINAGAYTNIGVPTSGAYGGDFSRLRVANDPRYTTNTIYEGIRGNWVWESGMDYGTPNYPLVYLNDVLTSGYNVDYINGRIVFDVATTGTVTAQYSYKEVKVLSARENPLPKMLQYLSRRPDDSNFLANSGLHIGLRDSQIQLPCISIEAASRKSNGWEIGGSTLEVFNTVKCYILGESDYEVQQIADTLCDQESKTLRLFSIDGIATDNRFPLTNEGYLSPSALSYPELVQPTGMGGYLYTDGVFAGKTRIVNTDSQDGQWINQNLYLNTVTLVTDTILLKT